MAESIGGAVDALARLFKDRKDLAAIFLPGSFMYALDAAANIVVWADPASAAILIAAVAVGSKLMLDATSAARGPITAKDVKTRVRELLLVIKRLRASKGAPRDLLEAERIALEAIQGRLRHRGLADWTAEAKEAERVRRSLAKHLGSR